MISFRMRKSCRFLLFIGVASCASQPVKPVDDPISSAVAVSTFDSLWSKVRNTYVDTVFVSTKWSEMRATLRPRAQSVTNRSQLDKLFADALAYIPDSHFYIIPASVATEEPNPRTADGRGTVGLAVRVAEGNVVAWKVENGSPAWNAGIRPGQRVRKIEGKDTDSAMKRVQSLPEAAQPRALADMLHHLNGDLSPAVGDTVHVSTSSAKNLVAIPARGLVSQFGNLPPLAGLVTTDRISTQGGCVGLIAFNIWLPQLGSQLEKAVDEVRTCEGVIVDLRGNPGGLGAMVMGFGGYFVDTAQSLGAMRSRQVVLNFVINPRVSRSDGTKAKPFDGPMAIIVDPMSASTSEIFAAGMQRIGRARVFGERSAGAALPAMMERLPSGDVFVHAVADFTDPRGRRIEGSGAEPDELVPLRVQDLEAGRDAPVEAAVRWITSAKKS
jgi:carboxyl-terminal processing protease